MSGMFNNVGAQFMVAGEVIEKRTYKSEKSHKEFWYLNIAGKGETFEVQVSQDDFDRFVKDQGVKVVGRLGMAFNKIILIAEKCEALTPVAVVPKAAS